MSEHSPVSDIQNEQSTAVFLKTNGPSPHELEPDSQFMRLLDANTQLNELERKSYISQCKQEKQNDWLIKNVVGLKGAHRLLVQHTEEVKSDLKEELKKGEARFKEIESAIAPILAVWEKWASRRKRVWHILAIIVTLVLLPYLSMLAVEFTKAAFPKLFHADASAPAAQGKAPARGPASTKSP